MSGFSAGVAPPEQADSRDDDKAGFDKEFASVKPVDGIAFQGGIGEETVKKERGRSEVDAEMKRFPKVAAQAKTQIGSNNNKAKEIGGDGADSAFERLARRMNGIQEVKQPKARLFVQKQDGWMQ